MARGNVTPITHPPETGRHTRQHLTTGILLGLLLVGLSGCASRVWNPPLPPAPSAAPYVFANRLPRHNSSETFVVLAFSGGGTRSAAFSYGLLRKLRDTPVTLAGKTGSLLDEVDVISSVSGGSYTAAYYGLFGQRIFTDYERVFLHRDIEGAMLSQLAQPANLGALGSSQYNRGDMVAAWLGREVFANKTFADMSQGELPYIIINASDLNTGMTFSFIQQQFDFLCSDINPYPIANAVMASSAVPLVFAPITLANHNADCRANLSGKTDWVANALREDSLFERRYQVARTLHRYADAKRIPLVRLLDGGLTDNLGVRGSMASPVAHYGNVLQMKGAFDPTAMAKVKRVLVIIANAQQRYPDYAWSQAGREPGLLETLEASANAAIDLLNTETVELARTAFARWGDYLNAQRSPDQPKVKTYFVPLTFEQIRDEQRYERINAIPTTFHLQGQEVDTVISLAGELLDESAEFKAFLRDTAGAGQ